MKRVVITGLGVISPIGSGWRQFWPALLAGKSGIRRVASFDTAAFPVHIGAEVPDFAPANHPRSQTLANLGRGSQLAVVAALQAVEDAGVELRGLDPYRVGVSMGTTSGEPLFIEQYNNLRQAGKLDELPAEAPPKYPCHVIPANVAAEVGAQGPCLMIPTACAAGNYAIGHAFDLIRTGRADVMLAGGADAFSRITYTGFARLGAIAPEQCQPFDRNRKGMVPGEGAAVLVLESRDAALARGAAPYAEILGYGLSCDSHHMTASHPEGEGAVRAMAMAMRESGVGPDMIDYISAHGTGTPTNDRMESTAAAKLFGARAARIPMSSIKSMIGHTMGAASAIEATACALALKTGVVPPTINYQAPDPDCPVDCVPNQAREVRPRIVLNNAYAFGGNNASLCLARSEP